MLKGESTMLYQARNLLLLSLLLLFSPIITMFLYFG